MIMPNGGVSPLATRRRVLGGMALAGTALPLLPRPLAAHLAAQPARPLSGRALYDSVCRYDAFGEHRTASAADRATSDWLASRLARVGFAAETPSFPFVLFEPETCALEIAGLARFALFPCWPVVSTGAQGLRAALAAGDAASLRGRIAVTSLPYRAGATLLAPGIGDHLLALVEAGAAAIVAITQGPTGEIMALNAAPRQFAWPVPLVLAAGRDGSALMKAAREGRPGQLVSTGKSDPNARATNVIARRRGKGKTIVVSTPKSGWFRCAGERGSGIAVFLGLAEEFARSTESDLCFIATSGHEFQGVGGQAIVARDAPPPDAVRLWLHLGANVACNDVTFVDGRPAPLPHPQARRGLMASADLRGAVLRAFAGQAGYAQPVAADSPRAVGEVQVFRKAGYRPLLGLVGAHPLFHTRLDRAAIATSPAMLAPVAQALASVIAAAAL